jgi:hypothetical protein
VSGFGAGREHLRRPLSGTQCCRRRLKGPRQTQFTETEAADCKSICIGSPGLRVAWPQTDDRDYSAAIQRPDTVHLHPQWIAQQPAWQKKQNEHSAARTQAEAELRRIGQARIPFCFFYGCDPPACRDADP